VFPVTSIDVRGGGRLIGMDLNRDGWAGLRNWGDYFRAHEIIEWVGGVGRQAMEHREVKCKIGSELRRSQACI
jgi:hypothetical protein